MVIVEIELNSISRKIIQLTTDTQLSLQQVHNHMNQVLWLCTCCKLDSVSIASHINVIGIEFSSISTVLLIQQLRSTMQP